MVECLPYMHKALGWILSGWSLSSRTRHYLRGASICLVSWYGNTQDPQLSKTVADNFFPRIAPSSTVRLAQGKEDTRLGQARFPIQTRHVRPSAMGLYQLILWVTNSCCRCLYCFRRPQRPPGQCCFSESRSVLVLLIANLT